ncbi:MAG: peptide chain release factor N(5)-glutamine methyltransferase [Cyclobacteriaceae bacterium]
MPVIYKETVALLATIYELREAEAIANRLFEDHLGIHKITRLTTPEAFFSPSQDARYKKAIPRLLTGEPLQYIIGAADFYGRRFGVNNQTLIPRNETEELVDWIIKTHKHQSNLRVLDIGTGSGCIAICLELELKHADTSAYDFSLEAITQAQKNAVSLGSNVHFEQIDILSADSIPSFDIIVSNPPYIPMRDQSEMHTNVLSHEPHSALFVPDDNPLMFYDKITSLASKALNRDGKLYFEIHENFGNVTKLMIEKYGFNDVVIRQDLNGKDRMICATKAQ